MTAPPRNPARFAKISPSAPSATPPTTEPTSKNIVNELSALARSSSSTRFTTFAISEGYRNAMPTPTTAAPTHRVHGSRMALISTRPTVSEVSAIVTMRCSPIRSGSLAPNRRSDRLTAL